VLVGQFANSLCLNFTGPTGDCVNRLQKHFVLVSLSCSVLYDRTWMAAYLYEHQEADCVKRSSVQRQVGSLKMHQIPDKKMKEKV